MFSIGNWTRGLADRSCGDRDPSPPRIVCNSATVRCSGGFGRRLGGRWGMMVDQARLTVGTKQLPGRPGASELVADGLLSVVDAARFLSVSRSKLYEMMDAGELP